MSDVSDTIHVITQYYRTLQCAYIQRGQNDLCDPAQEISPPPMGRDDNKDIFVLYYGVYVFFV